MLHCFIAFEVKVVELSFIFANSKTRYEYIAIEQRTVRAFSNSKCLARNIFHFDPLLVVRPSLSIQMGVV